MIESALESAMPMAIGLALSPLPVLALLIILMTANARSNALWFLSGWVFGIVSVGGLAYFIPSLIPEDSSSSGISLWIRFITGIFLLIGAWYQYRKRPNHGEAPRVPGWITRLDDVSARQSIFTGFALSGLNVKNAVFIGGGIIAMITAGVSDFSLGAAFIIFMCIGSTFVILPIVLFYIFGTRAEASLAKARHWLSRHIHSVLALLLLVISLILLYQSVPGLLMQAWDRFSSA